MKTYKFEINGDKYKAKILEYKGDSILVKVNGVEYKVDVETEIEKPIPKLVRSRTTTPDISVSGSKPLSASARAGELVAPIPGLIHTILVKEGDIVKSGKPVIILEAMKMESEILANNDGKIIKILVKEGESVQERQLLMEIGE
ncbi:MAG: acetyl-CoA carboxylase biotin carboxyl carrier protein subunit [Candidatus Cloacimonetes bacterium]|nr:acetyl-CoA carboxylase biotin carboxyl carrier protein subunit [Candidatus Cloacimonadota bacterium]